MIFSASWEREKMIDMSRWSPRRLEPFPGSSLLMRVVGNIRVVVGGDDDEDLIC